MPALCHWNLKMMVSVLPWVAGFCVTWFGFVFIWKTSNYSGFHTFFYILCSGCFISSGSGVFLVFWLCFCVCMCVCVCVCVFMAFPMAQWGKNRLQCGRPKRCGFNPWTGKIPWRRKWQLTPVFFSGEFHGQRSLAGYSPWVGVAKSQTRMSDINGKTTYVYVCICVSICMGTWVYMFIVWCKYVIYIHVCVEGVRDHK